MKTTTIYCDFCQLPFDRPTNEVNRSRRRGLKQYCDLNCAGNARSAKPKIKHEPNVTCALCGIAFYKRPSHMINSVHGIYFCCRQHKDEAQRIGGIQDIMPPHYGEGSTASAYKRVATEHHPKICVGCGYDTIPEILEVHHKDGDRSNADPDNLEWRCGRCHDEHHFLDHTGKWNQGEASTYQ